MQRSLSGVAVLCVLVASMVQAQDETFYQKGYAAYQAAAQLRTDQQFDAAAEAFEAMARDFPGHDYADDAHYLGGYVYAHNLKQDDKAVALWEAAIDKYPQANNTLNIMGQLAGAYARQGDNAKAAQMYLDMADASRHTTSEENYRYSAVHQYRAGKHYDKVAEAVDAYIEHFGVEGTRGLDLLQLKVQAQLDADDRTALAAAVKQLEEAAPESAQLGAVYYSIANAMRQQKDFVRSTQFWIKASEITAYTNAHNALWNAASDVVQSGDPPRYDDGIGLYRRYMEQFPKGPYRAQALLQIADLHNRNNNANARIETYREYLKTFHDAAQADWVTYQIALSMQQAKQEGFAIEAYKKLIQTYPQSQYMDEALLNLARMLATSGFPDQARPLYMKLIKDHEGTSAADAARQSLSTMR